MSFCTRPHFNPWLLTHLCCSHRLYCPLLIFSSINTTPISVVTEVVLQATSIPTTTATATNTGLIFVASIPLLPPTESRATSSRIDGPLVLGSGLLTGLLSRTSYVNCASPPATQPLDVPSFVVVANNYLPILLWYCFWPYLVPEHQCKPTRYA